MTVSQETARLGRSAFTRTDWAWQERAACRGEDLALFFGADQERGPDKDARERAAKLVCMGCPVRTECLEEALREPGQYGIWGGMDPDERTVERRRRQRRRSAA